MDLKAEARRLAEFSSEEWENTEKLLPDIIESALLAFGRLVREEDAQICEEIALKSSLGSFRERNTASYCADTIRVSAKSLK